MHLTAAHRRISNGLVLAMLLTGCQPASLLPTITPTAGSTGTPHLTPVQTPLPVVAPAAATSRSPVTEFKSTVTFPPGAWLKLKAGLRTQGLVSPEEISDADLASLHITINGQTLTRDQVRFSRLIWDDKGQLVAQLAFVNLSPLTQASIQVATATGSVALQAMVDATSQAVATIDVRSTAAALIAQKAAANGTPIAAADVDERTITLVANRLSTLMASSLGTRLLDDRSLQGLVTAATDLLTTNAPAQLSQGMAVLEQSMSGSGGGGGSSSSPSTGSTTTAFSATNVNFGIPRMRALVSTGTKLFAGGDYYELQQSSDDGNTWTTAQTGVYPLALLLNGGTLYGAGYGTPSIWSMPTGGGSLTSLVDAGLPANFRPTGLLHHGGKLYVANAADGRIYVKDLSGGLWTQFGTGMPSGDVRVPVTDGTLIYAVFGTTVCSLDPATPSGAWTSVGAATVSSRSPLVTDGGNLYATSGGDVLVWDGTSWSTEAIDSGASIIQVEQMWVDGTDLVAFCNVQRSTVIDGITQNGQAGMAYKRPLAGGSWTATGDDAPPWGDNAGQAALTHNGYWFVGPRRKPLASNPWTRLATKFSTFSRHFLVAAGGKAWALNWNHVYRLDPTAGTWSPYETGLPAGWMNEQDAYRIHAAGNQVFLATRNQIYVLDASQPTPSWTTFGTQLSNAPFLMADDGSNLFVMGTNRQVYAQPLTGGAWSAHGPVAPAFTGNGQTVFTAVNGRLFTGDGAATYELASAGGTWTALGTMPADYTQWNLVATPARLISTGVVTNGTSAARQWDGTAWTELTGLPSLTYDAPSLLAGADGIYAAYRNGFFKLGLGTTTWSQMNSTLLMSTGLAFDSTSGTFFASGGTGGIWKSQ